jgi:hypothetical protein
MVTAKNRIPYQARNTERMAKDVNHCDNCGHLKHCDTHLWGTQLGGDLVTTYTKFMPNYYMICFTCQCVKCKGSQ